MFLLMQFKFYLNTHLAMCVCVWGGGGGGESLKMSQCVIEDVIYNKTFWKMWNSGIFSAFQITKRKVKMP